MRLLLTSFGHRMIPEFVRGRLAYVPDAARTLEREGFVRAERLMLEEDGVELVDLPLASTSPDRVDAVLASVDGVYVAGGETFDLLSVLRATGTDEVLARHVRAGLPYVGCSAGSIVAGPSIEPAALLDSPDIAPDLTDHRGLGLTGFTVIPHAAGNLPPYTIDVIAETVRVYGRRHRLVLLRDGEALLVDDSGTRIV